MKKTFLGKSVPQQRKLPPKSRPKTAWFGLLMLPALLAGGLLSLQQSQLTTSTGPRSTGAALGRSIDATRQLAAVPAGLTTTLGDTTGSSAPVVSQVPNPCTMDSGAKDSSGHSLNQISEAFHRSVNPSTGGATFQDASNSTEVVLNNVVLFPIIPDGIRGVNPFGVDVTNPVNNKDNSSTYSVSWCSQPFWTREVMYWFVYKGLAFLNWAALAVAILLSIYAAILYISGFANEANVKKAKSILIAAYTGLIIVFLAKVIVFGVVNAVSGVDPQNVGAPAALN